MMNLFFLGATPDAVFQNGIIEIKCPVTVFGMSADEAIRAKKVIFWKVDKIKMMETNLF